MPEFIKIIFLKMFTVSLIVGLLIAVIMVAAPWLAKRYSPRWRYRVWLFLALWLMVPITLPAPWAPISLTVPDTVITPPHSALPQDILGSAGNNQTQNPGTAWPEEQNQGQGLTGSTNPATSVSGQTGSESGLLAPASDLSGSASGLAGSTSSARISGILAGITLFDILITIWLLGAAAFLCTRGIAVLRFRVWLHRSWRYCDSMDVTRFVRQTMTETGFQRDMDIMTQTFERGSLFVPVRIPPFASERILISYSKSYQQSRSIPA